MKNISFTKMSAAGNDFIVIDNRRARFPARRKSLIRNLCARCAGIGADGILLLCRSQQADFRMRIFNPDGSEPEMCGNGARCIALYARHKRLIAKQFTMETKAGIIKGTINSPDKITLFMGAPQDIRLNLKIKVAGKYINIYTINTGVPHVILYVNNINEIAVEDIGRRIRYLKKFAPAGTNVNFVQLNDNNRIAVRTYERGVEKETLACGTGAVASAIISRLVHRLAGKIMVKTRSKDILKIDTREVTLTGPAREVYKGALVI